jgi:hypothetical protein
MVKWYRQLSRLDTEKMGNKTGEKQGVKQVIILGRVADL